MIRVSVLLTERIFLIVNEMGAPQKDDKLSFWRWSNQRKKKTTVKCESEKSRTVTKESIPGTSKSLQENPHQTTKMKPHRRSHGPDRPEREREDETVVIESGRSVGNVINQKLPLLKI